MRGRQELVAFLAAMRQWASLASKRYERKTTISILWARNSMEASELRLELEAKYYREDFTLLEVS